MDPEIFHQYRVLNPSVREIRLVVLLPGKLEDAICCDLVHESLDAQPVYNQALSAHQQSDPGQKGILTEVYNIWGLLRDQFQKHASNPSDKIYGLLGMIEPWAQGLLDVDYSASLSDVYYSAAISLIQRYKLLLMFTIMMPPEFRDPSLPSWCPDWSLSIEFTEQRHVDPKVVHFDDSRNDSPGAVTENTFGLPQDHKLSARFHLIVRYSQQMGSVSDTYKHRVKE